MNGKRVKIEGNFEKTGDTKSKEKHGKKNKRSSDQHVPNSTSTSDERKTSKVTGQTTSHHASVRNKKPKQTPSLAAHARSLLPQRQALPIYPHSKHILSSIRAHPVLILVGETGSGKSTQLPQLLASEPWCTKRIAITQPRRVAAISLAKRVAEEMGSTLGTSSPASKVGYSVRFDNNVGGSATKVKFLTEGMLLREMLGDAGLEEYSVVVVDEVHERSVNVDLILGFLRRLVCEDGAGRKGEPLKIVVMSATADVQSLEKFFAQGFAQEEHATSGDGDTHSESSWSGLSDNNEDTDRAAVRVRTTDTTNLNRANAIQSSQSNGHDDKNPAISNGTSKNPSKIATVNVPGRQYPVETSYLPQPIVDFTEEALKTIFQIHYKEPLPGDVLVFLTGQDTVEAVESLVNEHTATMDSTVPRLLAVPIFAALPHAAQQAVFQPTPPRTRKVILATNIAETSVTIPGVRFVVDCGLAKVKEFRSQLGLDSLLVKPISKSSATQRKGRAGREAAGKCYRLYTERDYLKLQENALPEILRCDLAHSLLIMKARGVDDVFSFPLLDRPDVDALRKALLQLYRLGALGDDGAITASGRKMARLPLSPALGRVLIAAAEADNDCVMEVVDIIACLTVENVFLNINTEEKKEEAEETRRQLYRREGDHLTLMQTVRAYAAEQTDRKAWCERRFVSHRAMKNVMDVRKQLCAQCVQQKLLSRAKDSASEPPLSVDKAATVLKCFMQGFAANTARLMPDGSYRTLEGNQTVAIHPSSVLFGRKTEAIMYNELVFTTKCYARGVSAVQLNWYSDVVTES